MFLGRHIHVPSDRKTTGKPWATCPISASLILSRLNPKSSESATKPEEFIQVDGQTFQHEPRLKLLDVTTPAEVCVAVPKTPMNVEADLGFRCSQ